MSGFIGLDNPLREMARHLSRYTRAGKSFFVMNFSLAKNKITKTKYTKAYYTLFITVQYMTCK